MADQVLRVKFVADNSGGFRADVASNTSVVQKFGDEAKKVGSGGSAGTAELSAGMASVAAETRKARADMVAFLASSQIQKLGGEWEGFGNIVAASVAGRAAFSLAEFGSATAAAIVQQNAARVAALANAAALTVEHQAKVANFIATTATGTASAGYTAALRAEIAASLQATVAARAHAATLTATGGAFALLGGPAGAIALAAGALAFFALQAKSASDEADNAAKKNEALAESAKKVSSDVIAANVIRDRARIAQAQASGNPLYAKALEASLRPDIERNLSLLRSEAVAAKALADVYAEVGEKKGKSAGKTGDDKPPEKFKDEFATHVEASKDFQKTLADVSDALNDQLAKLTLTDAEYYRHTLSVKGFNQAQIEQLGALYDINEGLRQNADEARKAAEEGKALAAVLDSIFPDEARGRKFAEDFQILARNLKGAELDAAATALGKQFVGDPDAKKAAEQSFAIYEDIAQGIRGSFRDTFRDVLDDGVKSFSDLGDKVTDVFKDTLAELATLALARQIIVPTVLGVAGAAGVSQQAQAGIAGNLGAAGATAINPVVGAAILGGTIIHGLIQADKAERAEHAQRVAEIRAGYAALNRDIAREVAEISSTSSAAAREMRAYNDSIRDAADVVRKSSGIDRVNAERTLFDAIKSRYAFEIEALDGVKSAIKGIAEEADSVRRSVFDDARKVAGLDEFRNPANIQSAARGVAAGLSSPSDARYLSAREDETRYAELARLLGKIGNVHPGVLPSIKRQINDISPGLLNHNTPDEARKLVAGLRAANSTELAESQTEYLESLNNFAAAASKNIDILADLRDESLRWYEAQVKIADGLRSASSSIKGVLDSIELNRKTPGARLDFLVDQFRNTSLDGGTGTESQRAAKLADAAQSLVTQSGPILSLARELFGSTGGFAAIEELISSRLTGAKGVVDAATPGAFDAQLKTLDVLATIDTSLLSVKTDLGRALETINKTMSEAGQKTIEALNAILTKIGNTTGDSAAADAIKALARDLATRAQDDPVPGLLEAIGMNQPVVSVTNEINGNAITDAVITTINTRGANGETVPGVGALSASTAPNRSNQQAGGRFGGGM